MAGAYVLKPLSDTTILQTGYFVDDLPIKGRVVAVDWDYIFLREKSKMILEYFTGNGKVLAIGGYLLYSLPNRNRMHLEQFTQNIIAYLNSEQADGHDRYWRYGYGRATDTSFFPGPIEPYSYRPFTKDPEVVSLPDTLYEQSCGNYWDLAGERMLMMGTDSGGITEIWAHPVLCYWEAPAVSAG